MDNTTFTPDNSSVTSLLDIEAPVFNSRSAASLVALVIDEITRSQHPEIAAPEGSQLLLVEDDTIDALNHAVTVLLAHTREASDVFQEAATGTRTIPGA